jgi:prefoldin subunit 5
MDATSLEIGQLKAQVEALTETVKTLSKQVEEVSATLNQAKGGWRVMVLVGSAFAALGALAAKFLHFNIGS